MKNEADTLLDQKHYQAAILFYALFTENIIINANLYIIRENSIDEAIKKREEILSKKTKNSYEFGKVLTDNMTNIEKHFADKSIMELAVNIKKIRNMISAHPQFTLMLDPTNSQKKAFYDVNYYRKILRKFKNFMIKDIGIQPSDEVSSIIKRSQELHPLSSISTTEEIFIESECLISWELAKYCKNASEDLITKLSGILKE